MTIKDVDEFAFINSLKPHLKAIGDDCAVLPYQDNQVLLITTDSLVEDIHFLLSKIPAYDLGIKALAVNLSDIAAMGGRPLAATIAISMPSHIRMEWLKQLYEGLQAMALEAGVEIVGGDTTGSPGPLFINVTVFGTMPKNAVKRRSAAKRGDIVCVTGNVGDSGAGLYALIHDKESSLIEKHYKPRPHLAEGAFLSQISAVHAMMDLSDGLISDLNRIAEESHCELVIEVQRLPLSEEFTAFCDQEGLDKIEMGLTGGEDYCLLTTIAPEAFLETSAAFEKQFARPLYAIGEVTSSHQSSVRYEGCGMTYKGFSHFA